MMTAMVTIAVVDDDPVMLQLVESVLREAGYATTGWPSGLAAFERIARDPPDLIILDLVLDGNPESGWEVLSLFRVEPRTNHIPVILLSGNVQFLERRERILRTRKHALVLGKPFDIDTLLQRVEEGLALRQEA
jgi:CheY-like chemotaxis protein